VNEMVKRVADAIAALPNGIMDVEQVALVAIKTMREPTEAMLKAGSYDLRPDVVIPPKKIWEAMIDAAL
jgi:hypothetical protein